MIRRPAIVAARRFLGGLLRRGLLLPVLLVACSQSEPVQVSQSSPQPAVPPTPQSALGMPSRESVPETAGSEVPSPEELVAALPPVEQAQAVINFLAISLFAYRCHTGQYPTQQQGLGVLVERPADLSPEALWQGPYSPQTFLNDPWQRPYEYRWLDGPEVLFTLRSLGPDGLESEDDIALADLSKTRQFAHRDYVDHFAELYSRQSTAAQDPFQLLAPPPLE